MTDAIVLKDMPIDLMGWLLDSLRTDRMRAYAAVAPTVDPELREHLDLYESGYYTALCCVISSIRELTQYEFPTAIDADGLRKMVTDIFEVTEAQTLLAISGEKSLTA